MHACPAPALLSPWSYWHLLFWKIKREWSLGKRLCASTSAPSRLKKMATRKDKQLLANDFHNLLNELNSIVHSKLSNKINNGRSDIGWVKSGNDYPGCKTIQLVPPPEERLFFLRGQRTRNARDVWSTREHSICMHVSRHLFSSSQCDDLPGTPFLPGTPLRWKQGTTNSCAQTTCTHWGCLGQTRKRGVSTS